MPYSLAIKRKFFLKIFYIVTLIFFTSDIVAQENGSMNINSSSLTQNPAPQAPQVPMPSKPKTKTTTASPILKNNKNPIKPAKASAPNAENSAPIKNIKTPAPTIPSNPQPPIATKENTIKPALNSQSTNQNFNKNPSTPSANPTPASPSNSLQSPAKTPAVTDEKNIAKTAEEKPKESIDQNLNKNIAKKVAPKKNIKKTKKVKKIKKTKPVIVKTIETENKKFITESGRKINSDYFLQIIAKKSCDSLTNTECFRRDRKFEEPYFHKTVISIFNNKIIAEQYFTTTNNKKIFLKVNNGNYQLTTTNDNLISFSVQNGIVKDLILYSGNLERETFMASKCVIAEKNYGFFLAHNQQPKISEASYFANKNNFEGVRNLIIFSDIENIDNLTLQDLMAVEVKAYNNIVPIQNLNLCKRSKSDILEVRDISKAECRKRQECLILINSNPDFKDKIIDESCLGYFDSKREDFVSCSKQDDCNDYTVIKDCEVKLMAGE